MVGTLVLYLSVLFSLLKPTLGAHKMGSLCDQREKDLLSPIARAHYRYPETFVKVGIQNGNSSRASLLQEDLITELLSHSGAWISVSHTGLVPNNEQRPAYYNIVLVRDAQSLGKYVANMNHEAHHFHGLYTVVLEHSTEAARVDVMEMLWRRMILNVAVVSKTPEAVYVAHSYHPYTASNCGVAIPMEIGRYVDGAWTGLADWFAQKTTQFNGCKLIAGVVDIKPFSMHRSELNKTVHKGIEVTLANYMAYKMNFTIEYRLPEGNVKWGILLPSAANSTGLVGMIQRREVDFGFSCLGISASRYQYLRLGTASRYGQLLMAIPPKRPYTSFEKLFQPFSLQSWLCIIVCYALICLIAQAVFNVRQAPGVERLPNAFYTLWVLLMGGSCNPLRLDSSRLFIIGFLLNTLVIRTLYHAGMFERLQASDSLASDLNTFGEINRAGMAYYMHKTISLYFRDNPQIDSRKIRFILDTATDWEQLLYDLSQHKLDGVVTMPLDCIKYYIKQIGQRGVVYVAKSTGINYNTAFFFPKTSSLQESFSSMILRLHSAGLPNYWSQEFEDNRYWSNAKSDPEPSSLQWGQISGGFYLCGILHLLAIAVFFGEIGWYWFGPKLRACIGKQKQPFL